MPKGHSVSYTKEHDDFLRKHYKAFTYKELTETFNAMFQTNLPVSTISGKLKRMGLLNGRDCRFKKGNIPPNKGKKRWWVGGEETQFKKGNIPTNYKPIGSERIGKKPKNSNLGYTEIKVADPNKWKMKHVIVWEAVNGPVPKGHCVIFADRDKSNFDIDNLLLVSRAELARMNQKGYIFENAELTKTGHIMAKLDCALGNKKNQK